MHIEDVEALTSWLIRELKPICDAEPPVLAKYVLSLIRKPDKTDDEIKEFCSAQLEVFLQGNTKRFVDKMFMAIKDGSYLEAEKDKTEDEKPLTKEEKRPEDIKAATSRETKPEIKKAPPPRKEEPLKKEEPKIVRKRISPPAVEAKKEVVRDRRRSRSPTNRRDRRRSPARRHRRSRSRSRSGERDHRKNEDMRKSKRRCRDYDEKGVCTRGDMCQFDHGPDPVVFDREVMDMMGSLGPKGAPTPNLSVPPPGYNPPPPGVDNIYNAPAGNVEGYNPEAPALTSANYSVPPPPLPLQMNQAPWRPTPYAVNAPNVGVPMYDPNLGVPVDPTSGPTQVVHGAIRGGGMMRGRGRGRGGHMGAPHFNRSIGDGKTIQVSRIPTEENNITKLNEHFSQFGNISNIQVRFEGDPSLALITFTCKAEATAALKSPSPVLNNRFIRTEFYRPPETENSSPANNETSLSSGVVVTKPAVPAQPVDKKIAVGESKFVNTTFTAREKAKSKKKDLQAKAKGILDAQKKQMTLLDSLLKQQKNILAKLKEEIVEPEAKKRLKDMSKTTSEQINVAKTMFASLARQLEENRKAVLEIDDVLNTIAPKSPSSETANGDTIKIINRKRVAAPTQVSPSKKKLAGSALLVSGFTMDIEHKVTEAMESHGELIDVEIQPGTGSDVSAIYVYKERSDAEKVLNDPPEVNGSALKIIPKSETDVATRLQPVEAV